MSRCILHVGMRKTGSTSIQKSLKGFENDKFLYMSIGKQTNHGAALYSLVADNPRRMPYHKNNHRTEFAILKYKESVIKAIEKNIARSGGKTIVFSGESCSSLCSEIELERLRDFLHRYFKYIDVVGYIRPPGEYINSNFQERTKDAAYSIDLLRDYPAYYKTFSKFYNVFGTENVQWWKFDSKSLHQNCVVMDFCSRLHIDLASERIIRINESISREAVALLFIFRKFGEKYGSRTMTGPENRLLINKLSKIGQSRFRFSPDIIKPILEENHSDIEWMETRLGQSLDENLGVHQAGDVREEADLIEISPKTIDELHSMLGEHAPKDVTGQTPGEVALLVYSLFRLSILAKRRDRSGHVVKRSQQQMASGISADVRQVKAADMKEKNDELRDSSRTRNFFQTDETVQQQTLSVGRIKNKLSEKKPLSSTDSISRCIIHIGMHKTGTSSIQSSLRGFENDQFVYFSGQMKYGNHSGVVFGLVESSGADRPGFRKQNKRFANAAPSTRQELKDCIQLLKGRDLLLSGEGIRFLSLEELMILRGFFMDMGMPVKIVAYIRSPASFLISFAQQQIRAFSKHCLELDWDLINYQKSFTKFDTLFGAENIELWKFDPKTLIDGCVVKDFCSRLGIDFPIDRVVRVNESLSREALSLMYLYRRYYSEMQSFAVRRKELNILVESVISQIGNTKFRISPDVLRPILDDNRADIEWMEHRLGESLTEELGEHRESDVRDETDLLTPSAGAVTELRRLLDEHDANENKLVTPEEIAHLFNALLEKYAPSFKEGNFRQQKISIREGIIDTSGDLQIDAADIIEAIKKETPGVLNGIPNGSNITLVSSILQVMANDLATMDKGKVKYPGLGHFMKSERNLRGKKRNSNHMVFIRHSPIKSRAAKVHSVEPGDLTVERNNLMNKIHFFVHIPKTAGTSFRKALEKNEKIRMLYDYGGNSAESSQELLAIDTSQLTPDNDIFHRDKHNILCGHVHYQQYAHCVFVRDVFAIVRNPIERIVSEYQHLKRHFGLVKSFEEFYSMTNQRNKQMRLLQGLETDEEVLIGLTSHYNYFVELFSDRLSLPIETIAVNKATVSDIEERLHIDAGSINAAYHYNKKDITFFFDVARKFAEAVRKKGYNTTPAMDTVWNCRIDGSRQLVGWFPCDEKDCYFVVIKKNNEMMVILSLDQDRKDIVAQGFSKSSVCGFRYPLSMLGAEKGDTLSVGILDSKMNEKKMAVE